MWAWFQLGSQGRFQSGVGQGVAGGVFLGHGLRPEARWAGQESHEGTVELLPHIFVAEALQVE